MLSFSRVRANDGSDATDLIGEIEDAFDVSIEDSVAATLVTPGKVFDYLLSTSLHSVPRGACLSHALFNRVRRAILVEFQVKRQEVKPKTPIAELIPQFRIRTRRMAFFKRLSLRRPPPIIVDRHWFKRNYGTFGDLTKDILAWNYGALAEEAGAWNPKEGWSCLRLLIAKQTGNNVEIVTRNAEFVSDLGID